MGKAEPCEKCGRRYKVLEGGLCFFCYQKKYGDVPTKGLYKNEKDVKKSHG